MAKNNLHVLMIISVIIFIPLVLFLTNKLDFMETFESTTTSSKDFSTIDNSEIVSNSNCKAQSNGEDTGGNGPKCPDVPDMSLYVLKSSLPPKMDCPPCICPKVEISGAGCKPEDICVPAGYTKLVSTTQKPALDEAVKALLEKYQKTDQNELLILDKIQELMKTSKIGELDSEHPNKIFNENKSLHEQIDTLTKALEPKPTQPTQPTVDIQAEINKMLHGYNENPEQLAQLRLIKKLLDQSSLETTGELEDDLMGLEGSNEELNKRNKNLQKKLKQLQEQINSQEHPYTTQYSAHNQPAKKIPSQEPNPLDTLINQMVNTNGKGKGNYETPSPNSLTGVDNLTGYHDSVYKAWETSDNNTCS